MDLKEQFRRISERVRKGWDAANDDPMHAVMVRAPRFASQLDLEERIVTFNPDANEAAELICALAASLKTRYDNPTEVLLHLTLAKNALARLDNGLEIDAREELEALEEQARRKP